MSENNGGETPFSAEWIEHQLRPKRRELLRLADMRKSAAMGLDSRAIGVATEVYVVTVADEVPFPSQRIRIVPHNVSQEAPTEGAPKPHAGQELKELYLYYPFDTDFKQGPGESAPSTMIFMSVVTTENVVMRYVISRNKTAAFLSKDEMHVDSEHFETRETDLGIDAIFPATGDRLEGISEYMQLDAFLSILQDTGHFRLTSQAEPRAA